MQEDNSYIFGDVVTDRHRLETQTQLFSNYVRENARTFVAEDVHSILDLGCGEGQLGLVLREVYPDARLVGIDKDEQAIAVARSKAAALGLRDVEFVVGDIEQALPEGPFDLIYASAVFMHTRQPQDLMRLAYARLNPSGYLWIKDFDPAVLTDPALADYGDGLYMEMTRLLMASVAAIGGHPYYMNEASEWLRAIGFSNVRRERETVTANSYSETGRAVLAISLGAFYNARPLIRRTQGRSDEELTSMYVKAVNAAMASRDESRGYMLNIIAQKLPLARVHIAASGCV